MRRRATSTNGSAGSTVRHAGGGWVDPAELPKGPNGRTLCRWCESEITEPRRRTFCSQECVEEHRIRTSASYARYKVFERDRGVCALCGVQAVPEGLIYKRLDGTEFASNTGHLWQADHIVPVVEGGGKCGLENLRTLCTSCHKSETAKLARRRSKRKR